MRETEQFHRTALLRCLRTDVQVRSLIREIAASQEETPVSPVQTAQEDVRSLEERCLAAERALEAAQQTIAAQEQRMQALRQQCGQMQEVMAAYARLETVYGRYLELPEDIRESCGRLCNDSSPIAFAVTGAADSTIRAWYELICGQHRRGQVLAVLNECFDLFFDLWMLGHPDSVRLMTQPGEMYDPARHVLTEDSLTEGRITRVIVSGFVMPHCDLRVRSCVTISAPEQDNGWALTETV